MSDNRRRSQHVSAAKEALKNARRQEPENDGLTHLTAVVAGIENRYSKESTHGATVTFDDEVLNPVPQQRHLHERLGLSHLSLRDSNDSARPSYASDHSSRSSDSSPTVGSSAEGSIADIMERGRAAFQQAGDYESFDPDTTFLLRPHDEEDTSMGTDYVSVSGTPIFSSIFPDPDSTPPNTRPPRSPQWLVEQCQSLRKKLDDEKKERLKAEEKLMRAEDVASKLHDTLKKITIGEEPQPRPKVRPSPSRGSVVRQLKPHTPPSGRCAASSYEESMSSQKKPKRDFQSPAAIHYPGVTSSVKDDDGGSSTIQSSNSVARYLHARQEANRAHSMGSVGTVGSQAVSQSSPIISPAQPALVDIRELTLFKERLTADLTVRVMNGVSEEEIAKFNLPKSCLATPATFFMQLDRLCQDHAGHPLSRVHWLHVSPSGTERRHANMRMLQEIISTPVQKTLYLSTVPMPSPAELVVFTPNIRLKSLNPAKITYTGTQMSVPRLYLETTQLAMHHSYTIAFTDQWSSTTYIVESFVAQNRCGVYFGVPNALLKKEAGSGGSGGLYDIHLLVNGAHRSVNRRALAVSSGDRALSSNASSASFEMDI